MKKHIRADVYDKLLKAEELVKIADDQLCYEAIDDFEAACCVGDTGAVLRILSAVVMKLAGKPEDER